MSGKVDKLMGGVYREDDASLASHGDLIDMPDVTGVNADHDARYLTLDQTARQIVSNNTPKFASLSNGVLKITFGDGSFITENIVESEITLADNTTNNVTDAKHGFTPKLSGNAAQYLDGGGNYSTPTITDFSDSTHNHSDDAGGGDIETSKINPEATQDLNLFGDTDVADAVDGKAIIIHRKAAEGDGFIKVYIDQYENGRVFFEGDSGEPIIIESKSGPLYLQYEAAGDIKVFSNSGVGENRTWQQAGYITAAGARKYIQWQVSDTDDYFHLTREDANILGLKIEMPVVIQDIDLLTYAMGSI